MEKTITKYMPMILLCCVFLSIPIEYFWRGTSGKYFAFNGFLFSALSVFFIKKSIGKLGSILAMIIVAMGLFGFYLMSLYPNGGTPNEYKWVYTFVGGLAGIMIASAVAESYLKERL